MIQIILTTHILEPIQVILLLVVFAILVGVFIANRITLRRMHRHAKQSKFANQVMQEALKNSQDKVLQWHISEAYQRGIYHPIIWSDAAVRYDFRRRLEEARAS